jgi:hypothetical protein
MFDEEGLSALCSTIKLEGHSTSAVHDLLLTVLKPTLLYTWKMFPPSAICETV